ncbi:MAG: hypothetical protein ACI8SJ_001704, partial [Shewanella sp.]
MVGILLKAEFEPLTLWSALASNQDALLGCALILLRVRKSFV